MLCFKILIGNVFNVQNFKISKSNFVFGPDFELLGPNKRVDLIFQESGRPDFRVEKGCCF